MDIFDGYHEINEKIRYTDSKFSSLKNLSYKNNLDTINPLF